MSDSRVPDTPAAMLAAMNANLGEVSALFVRHYISESGCFEFLEISTSEANELFGDGYPPETHSLRWFSPQIANHDALSKGVRVRSLSSARTLTYTAYTVDDAEWQTVCELKAKE